MCHSEMIPAGRRRGSRSGASIRPSPDALNGLTIILGSALVVGSVVVALATWPSDHVLVSPADLEHSAAAALIPGWAWLMTSAFLFYGLRHRNCRRRWGPRPPRAAMALVGCVPLLCALTIVGGLFIGAAKGSLRILDGQHQVSSGSLNGGEWISVPSDAYQVWQARFLRLDSIFSLFGLVMMAVGARFRWLGKVDQNAPLEP